MYERSIVLKKKTLVAVIASLTTLVLVSGAAFLRIAHVSGNTKEASALASVPDSSGEENQAGSYTYIPPVPAGNEAGEDTSIGETEPEITEKPFVPATEMDLDPTSITVFVNKEYALPKDYVPEHLVTPNVIFNLTTYDERTLMRPEAAEALEQLFSAAKQDNIILYGISAYRSFQRQTSIFKNNIVKKGKTYTLRYSAAPGTSEHQTGLAIDVSAESQGFKLDNTFANSPEGMWLEKNSYQYGYIIRYPEGDEDITGYAFEPWHIRYVGKDLAKYLYTNHLTLEEYYHYTPSPDFDFEEKYASLINYKPRKVTPIPESDPSIVIGANGEIIDGSLEEEEVPDEESDDTESDAPTQGPKEKPTKTGTPTATPKPRVTPTPTPEPTPTPTIAPIPDAEPTPAEEPVATEAPIPTSLPEPTITEAPLY
jgi:D-alanyl-D-alanine carboxypeptidase